MSSFVEWIGAEAERWDEEEDGPNLGPPVEPPADEQSAGEVSLQSAAWPALPADNFSVGSVDGAEQDDPLDRNPDLWLYRKRTAGLLRRYMRFSIETGRLPSLLGREFFRAKVTYYKATTFEDRVIFVRDVENCLNRLEYWDQQLIARIILQEYGQEQAARILHCSRSKVVRRLSEVLDLLSEDFLRVGLLTGLPSRREFSQ
jgi:hypothetical protein